MNTSPEPGLARRASLLAALLLGSVSPALAAPQGPPAAVRVDPVRKEVLAERRPVTGELRSAHRSEIASRERGVVLVLEVREGQAVEAGDVLARLDSEQLELELSVLEAQRTPAEAVVAERESDLKQKRLDLRSLEELVGRKAANPKELADAETALAAAEARLSQGKGELLVLGARIAQLRSRIEDMTIVAPFAGTVTARRCERGAWLGEGASVCELVSTGELEAWLEVPQQLLAAARAGLGAVAVQIDASGEWLSLSGGRVVPDVDPRARTFALVAPIQASPSLAAGMSLTALIPTETRSEQLTISRDAILRNEVGTFVYVVLPGAEGAPAQAAPTGVEVLFHTEDRAVVRSDRLQPGAQVVVEGNERLFPMAPILPVPAGQPAEQPPVDGEER